MVTAGTYQKAAFFQGAPRLTFLTESLLALAQTYALRLQAWAVFANHYHFVAESQTPSTLTRFVRHLNSISAKYVNRLDQSPGRKVWHQYWDTCLNYHKSFLARLRYVHANPVKHGLVANAEMYEWCSAAWFARTTEKSFHATVMSFPSGHLAVPDDFD